MARHGNRSDITVFVCLAFPNNHGLELEQECLHLGAVIWRQAVAFLQSVLQCRHGGAW